MMTDELQQFIGKVAPPIIKVVETGAIRRYADAVGNHNPIYSDEEYAGGTRYGGIIATSLPRPVCPILWLNFRRLSVRQVFPEYLTAVYLMISIYLCVQEIRL
jgi:hypothetical protein